MVQRKMQRLKLTDFYFQIEMDSSKLMLTALRFNERINQQDLEGLAELMTDDHTLIVIANNKGETTKEETL
jgi:ketosteroid isomerase-like protein